ncbi:hypothetical protein V8E36_009010 [Tilletia maclaganii]
MSSSILMTWPDAGDVWIPLGQTTAAFLAAFDRLALTDDDLGLEFATTHERLQKAAERRAEEQAGLLSAVIAAFVTTSAGQVSAVVALYQLSLLLTLVTGVVALGLRAALVRLSATTVRPTHIRTKKLYENGTSQDDDGKVGGLDDQLVRHVQRMRSANLVGPISLSVCTVLLQLSISMFLVGFLISVQAARNSTASFIVGTAMAASCAGFLVWSLIDGMGTPSLFSGGSITALKGRMKKLQTKVRSGIDGAGSDVLLFGGNGEQQGPGRGRWRSPLHYARRLRRLPRLAPEVRTSSRTSIRRPVDKRNFAVSIVTTMRNFVALGSRSILKDLFVCVAAVYVYAFDSEAGADLNELAPKCSLVLKDVHPDDRLLRESVDVAWTLLGPSEEYNSAMFRPVLPSQAPTFKLPSNHLCLDIDGLRLLAWDKYKRRGEDFWSGVESPERLFRWLEKPCGHDVGDPSCQWTPPPMPHFLQHARKKALGESYDEVRARKAAESQNSQGGGANADNLASSQGHGAAAAALASSSSDAPGGDAHAANLGPPQGEDTGSGGLGFSQDDSASASDPVHLQAGVAAAGDLASSPGDGSGAASSPGGEVASDHGPAQGGNAGPTNSSAPRVEDAVVADTSSPGGDGAREAASEPAPGDSSSAADPASSHPIAPAPAQQNLAPSKPATGDRQATPRLKAAIQQPPP